MTPKNSTQKCCQEMDQRHGAVKMAAFLNCISQLYFCAVFPDCISRLGYISWSHLPDSFPSFISWLHFRLNFLAPLLGSFAVSNSWLHFLVPLLGCVSLLHFLTAFHGRISLHFSTAFKAPSHSTISPLCLYLLVSHLYL